ncbi:osmosensitive K+ channel signal transduction histidine kinase [Methylocella silvestris BL2]|uniref:histidine kinase n=1 Tax=Methylocella silvestris (strain DSM 15510 / CIP 108128 / LMG 27833 / NCIMB 13906 / BL2) TaxID=395965 RepID=B8ET99_METSB|nr:sensor histidine kinase KdpD [Methylocella silvestris]ACK51741.1 osmosensitive K+ channel signal transduction histidine kinase [Methylocella silvestris BL2]
MSERRDFDKRPSPDALLGAAEQETRGRLKVFFGAVPGVGKTYEMLTAAHARKAEGVDVVIGVVESHGRPETEALIRGLEIVPLRQIAYKGRTIGEVDLDAILKRRPQLVLMDELAHTNAPESRHPKRYLDVEELLNAGIDVYTTLNVQHLESLNDVVAQITRVRVQEKIPDSILDRADEIELIDLTPKDLIQRLHEGKVYAQDTAGRALENYFSIGNLTALRELALRRTAQRVDEQLLTHMQAHAISGPWAAGERILVCVNDSPNAIGLVRYGRRVAERLRAPWAAINIETGASVRLDQAARDRLAETLRQAERLGAEAIVLPGRTITEEILRYAAETNVTHIVIARSQRPRWQELLQGSVTHSLIRGAGDISVHVIAPREAATQPAKTADPKGGAAPSLGWKQALAVIGLVGLATAVGAVLRQYLDVHNVALVFLMGVLTSAVSFGLWPALFASIVSMLSFNFFFLRPLYTFTIADPESVVALVFFFIVAVIASNLTASVRSQAVVARKRAKTTEDLYLFSRKLAGVGALDDVLWAAAFQIASMLSVRVVILLPAADGSLEVRAGYPPEDQVEPADIAAARWAFESNRPAGRGADTLPGAQRLFLPMWTGRGSIGVVGLDSDREGALLTPESRRLLDALIDQTALAIERVNLVEDLDRARLVSETDRLRSALLTSISHDLRTPLASIMGAAGALSDFAGQLTDESKRELTDTIQEEAERLNRFIANLLDMTRLESGAVHPNAAPHDLSDVVGAVLKRARKILAAHRVEVALAPDLPMLDIDAVLFEQALFNLLDNAAKYAPAGSLIRLQAVKDDGFVVLQILDEGPGIPAADVERIFDKFTRAQKGDQVGAGTGLGLAVCRGFIEAMHGTIAAGNRSDTHGAVFTIRLPALEPASGELSA